ncbi:uncharacterized protein J3R85_011464 [Psidium guajava]|nr:uncharacterized protein J3R85_011464 [Psidium guajava]
MGKSYQKFHVPFFFPKLQIELCEHVISLSTFAGGESMNQGLPLLNHGSLWTCDFAFYICCIQLPRLSRINESEVCNFVRVSRDP